jgi:hypothetical protein
MEKMPKSVERKARGVGTQVEKVEERKTRKSFCGSQYCGSCVDMFILNVQELYDGSQGIVVAL